MRWIYMIAVIAWLIGIAAVARGYTEEIPGSGKGKAPAAGQPRQETDRAVQPASRPGTLKVDYTFKVCEWQTIRVPSKVKKQIDCTVSDPTLAECSLGNYEEVGVHCLAGSQGKKVNVTIRYYEDPSGSKRTIHKTVLCQ